MVVFTIGEGIILLYIIAKICPGKPGCLLTDTVKCAMIALSKTGVRPRTGMPRAETGSAGCPIPVYANII